MSGERNSNTKPAPHRIFIKCNEDLLISEIKKRPFLYDSDSKDYKKFSIRQRAWEEISEQINLTQMECKKRWRSLRDAFIKQFRNSDEERLTNWIHYGLLEFLIPFLTRDMTRKRPAISKSNNPSKYRRQTVDEDDNEYIGTEEYIEEETEENNVKVTVEYKTIKSEQITNASYQHTTDTEAFVMEEMNALDENNIDMFEEHILENPEEHQEFSTENQKPNVIMTACASTETKCINEIDDSDERFLLSCAPTMKRLSTKKNNFARLKIQQILYEIEFDEKL